MANVFIAVLIENPKGRFLGSRFLCIDQPKSSYMEARAWGQWLQDGCGNIDRFEVLEISHERLMELQEESYWASQD